MTKSIAFIGNVTSMSSLIGRELISGGFDVDMISGGSIFQTDVMGKTSVEKKKASIIHRAIRKYAKPLYREAINNKEYDIEIRSFSSPVVKAKHRVVSYHGNDLRDGSYPVEYPCFYSTVDLGIRYLDNQKTKSGQAIWLPRCFIHEYFNPLPRLPFDGKTIVIGHMPTDPKMAEKGLAHKGSEKFYSAVKILEQRGYNVNLITPETIGHLPHKEMSRFFSQIHVLADQFDVGQYGVTSMEAIACDRPAVCYVHNDYWEFPEMQTQIVNCEPDSASIADALVKAINHKVNPTLVKSLYHPKTTSDIMIKALTSWGMLN